LSNKNLDKKKMQLKGFIVLLFVGTLALHSCFKGNTIEEGHPVYTSYSPITNPPDTFAVRMDLNTNRLISTSITFEDTAVWKVFVSPSTNLRIWMNRVEDPEVVLELSAKEILLGLEGNVEYEVHGQNSSSSGSNTNISINFHKTAIDIDEADDNL
jgi:hypothetical protein